MQMIITSRHGLLDPRLRAMGTEVLKRLGDLSHRPVVGTVVFDHVAGRSLAEVRVQCAGAGVLVARAAGVDPRTALDGARSRVRRQPARTSHQRRSRPAPTD